MKAIKVEVKSVYGQNKIYPANEAAEFLCSIAGTKTLSTRHLDFAKRLGLVVEEISNKKLELV